MKINISHRDIGSELCQRCAACCRVTIPVVGTDPRYRTFLRTLGFVVLPEAEKGAADCCDKKHDVKLDMGYCTHLEIRDGREGPTFRCALYKTDRYPQLCSDYDCVSWAKRDGTYRASNRTLRAAQEALNRLRELEN